MIAAIIAFGLLGLALRAVPSVLTGDLLVFAAPPRVVIPGAAESAGPTPRTPAPSASATPSPRPTTTQATAKPRRTTVPATGPGTFRPAQVDVRPESSAGRLIRFDVKVEDNLDIDPDEAAKVIAGVLNDERSWRGAGGGGSSWSAATASGPSCTPTSSRRAPPTGSAHRC